LRVLVLTSGFAVEDAPEIAFALARCYQPAGPVRVAAMRDGPGRGDFARAGIPVEILDDRELAGAATAGAFSAAVTRLAATLDWGDVDLVVGSGRAMGWAVPVARSLGKASLLHLHEGDLAAAGTGKVRPAGVELCILESVTEAGRVVVPTEAARSAWEAQNGRDHFRVVPPAETAAGTTGPSDGGERVAAWHRRLALEAYFAEMN
jgi:hypothetical protein